jgi:hypothetical protein
MKYYAAVCKNGEFTGTSATRASYQAIVNWCEKQFAKDETITIEIHNAETFELIKTFG